MDNKFYSSCFVTRLLLFSFTLTMLQSIKLDFEHHIFKFLLCLIFDLDFVLFC